MKANPFPTKRPGLSEIIIEINDLRCVARAPDRPEQYRRRFCNRAFRGKEGTAQRELRPTVWICDWTMGLG